MSRPGLRSSSAAKDRRRRRSALLSSRSGIRKDIYLRRGAYQHVLTVQQKNGGSFSAALGTIIDQHIVGSGLRDAAAFRKEMREDLNAICLMAQTLTTKGDARERDAALKVIKDRSAAAERRLVLVGVV